MRNSARLFPSHLRQSRSIFTASPFIATRLSHSTNSRNILRGNRNPQALRYRASAARSLPLPSIDTMENIKVTFTPVALTADSRPSLARSGACAAALPAWHPHDAIMLGGYTEEWPQQPQAQPTPRRAPCMEAWTFTAADGGRWHHVKFEEGSPVPQPRLTSQAVVVGDELWLVAGWNPAAAAAGGGGGVGSDPGSVEAQPFLNDVWALDLRSYSWRRLDVSGEDMPRISRFAMAPMPDGRLLLHTHRCSEHIMILDPATATATATVKDATGFGTAAAAGVETAAGQQQQQQPTLSFVPVRGVFPGDQSPPSRGLHSLTPAAAPPPDLFLPPPPPIQTPEAAVTATSPAPTTEVAKATAATAATSGSGSAGKPDGEVEVETKPLRTAMYVYGGAPQSGPMYGDLWVLDLDLLTWRQLAPAGIPPQARCSHVAAAFGSLPSSRGAAAAGSGRGEASGAEEVTPGRFLLLMGGSFYEQPGRLKPLGDVAVYDTQTNRWLEMEVEGTLPSPRNAAVMVPLKRQEAKSTAPTAGGAGGRDGSGSGGSTVDRFVLHGGWRPFVETYNDT
ncbi:hypothetical protein Agub_g13065, partial [Astrephomene gubernaculifera]